MFNRGAERKRYLTVKLDTLSTIPALYFLLHEIFALTISYFYTVVSNDLLTQVIVYTYRLRDVCFIITFLFIIIKQKLTWDSVIISLLLFASYNFTKFIYPENSIYLETIRPYLALGVESFIVIRSRMVDWEHLKNSVLWLARILVVLVAVGLLNVPHQPQYLSLNYMTFSNAMLVPIAITIFSFYASDGIIRIIDIGLSLIGLIMILLYGARGAFVLLIAYAVIIIFMKTEKRKVLMYGLAFVFLTLIGLESLSSDNVLLSLVGGQQSRTIERLLSGELFTSNRNNIYSYLIGKSLEDGLLGHGMCADRYYLPFHFVGGDANYAHNYYVEMLVDFGVLGIMISIATTILIFRQCIRLSKSSYKAFLLSFFFVAFLQLMVSRSWLTEANFFIFIGLLMTYKGGIEDNHEEGIGTNTNISQ